MRSSRPQQQLPFLKQRGLVSKLEISSPKQTLLVFLHAARLIASTGGDEFSPISVRKVHPQKQQQQLLLQQRSSSSSRSSRYLQQGAARAAAAPAFAKFTNPRCGLMTAPVQPVMQQQQNTWQHAAAAAAAAAAASPPLPAAESQVGGGAVSCALRYGGRVLVNLLEPETPQPQSATAAAGGGAAAAEAEAAHSSSAAAAAVAAQDSKGKRQRLRIQLLWNDKRLTLNRRADERVGAVLAQLRLSCWLSASGAKAPAAAARPGAAAAAVDCGAPAAPAAAAGDGGGEQENDQEEATLKKRKKRQKDTVSPPPTNGVAFALARAEGSLLSEDLPAADAFKAAATLICCNPSAAASAAAAAAAAAVAPAAPNGRPAAAGAAAGAAREPAGFDALWFRLCPNAPIVQKVTVRQNLYAGCPVVASLETIGAPPTDFELKWSFDDSQQSPQFGPVFVASEEAVGRQLRLDEGWSTPRLSRSPRPQRRHPGNRWFFFMVLSQQHIESCHPAFSEFTHKCILGPVLPLPKGGWHQQRLQAFLSAAQQQRHLQRTNKPFRVVSFNILAAGYAQTLQADAVMAPLIGRELLMLDGDLLCLQECADDVFEEYLNPLLHSRGFSGFLDVKSKSSRVVEGCATFVRNRRFSVVSQKAFVLSEELMNNPTFKNLREVLDRRWPHLYRDVLPQLGTIVQLVALEDLLDKQAPTPIIANTHLFFHPRASHVRILQVYILSCLLEEFANAGVAASLFRRVERTCSVILCGDFNCDFASGGHYLLRNKHIPPDHADWRGAPSFTWVGQSSEETEDEMFPMSEEMAAAADSDSTARDDGLYLELPPSVHLNDCYKECPLPFTNYVSGFHATLDHIFASRDLQVLNWLPAVPLKAMEAHKGLPCEFYPSDHLSIAVDLWRPT
ncbi:hypothetical protein Esti_005446 [Eimeria stiedai]